jgi:hypothetical protein
MAEAGRDAQGWDAHRRSQLRLWAAATPAQPLAWLEEMIAMAYRTGALPRRAGVPPHAGRMRSSS